MASFSQSSHLVTSTSSHLIWPPAHPLTSPGRLPDSLNSSGGLRILSSRMVTSISSRITWRPLILSPHLVAFLSLSAHLVTNLMLSPLLVASHLPSLLEASLIVSHHLVAILLFQLTLADSFILSPHPCGFPHPLTSSGGLLILTPLLSWWSLSFSHLIWCMPPHPFITSGGLLILSPHLP